MPQTRNTAMQDISVCHEYFSGLALPYKHWQWMTSLPYHPYLHACPPWTACSGLITNTFQRDTEDTPSVGYAYSLQYSYASTYASFIKYGPKQGIVPAQFSPNLGGFFYYQSEGKIFWTTSLPDYSKLRSRRLGDGWWFLTAERNAVESQRLPIATSQGSPPFAGFWFKALDSGQFAVIGREEQEYVRLELFSEIQDWKWRIRNLSQVSALES